MSDCMHFPDTVEEFMEQYKMTDAKQVYSNGIEYVPIFRMKQWFEHENAQLSQEGTTSDLISRTETVKQLQGVLDVTVPITDYDGGFIDGVEVGVSTVSTMPPVQPEPAIPLSWIEKHIEWHKSLDNEFANLAAAHISVMVKKWRDEQNETD